MGNKPRIRFKGFTEDWEQCKLSDVADVRDGTHDSPKFYNDGFPLVTSKNLKGGSIDFSDCSFISEEDFNEINKRSKVDPGDILFGMIGTIGNPAIVEHTGFAIKNVALIKEGNTINNRFIYHLLSSKVFENYIARENAGGTQKFIALNQIRNFDFLAPALVEQNKIIELLDCISQNITLHQCKLEKLKLTKKALLQKLFPKNGKHIPEIRFKGFTDAWEQRKLIYIFNDFIVPMRDKPKVFSGTTPWTRIEDIEGRYINTSLSGQFVSDETIKSMNLKVIPKGSLIVSASATFGVVAIVNNDLITNQTFIGLVPNKDFDIDFLYSLFEAPTTKGKLLKLSAGSTIFYIARESFENLVLSVPSKEEQIKISKVFKSIDDSITLHQRKLERLQEVKKGLLQKMFV